MSKNRLILNALDSLDPADREKLLAWVERRDRELRQQLIGELEEKILSSLPSEQAAEMESA